MSPVQDQIAVEEFERGRFMCGRLIVADGDGRDDHVATVVEGDRKTSLLVRFMESLNSSGSRSHWLSAYPFSGVTRGLDPRVHPLRKTRFAKKMDCRVKPSNDGGRAVAAIPRPFEREPL